MLLITITIEHGFGIVRMKRICTTIWHAIGQLQALENTSEANEAMRLDRKRAFGRATVECLPLSDVLVCAPGQSQRLAMVLQGSIPEVQIERYDALESVSALFAQRLAYLGRELGHREDPDEALIRRHMAQAYFAGRALYVGDELKALTQQFREFADLTYGIEDRQPEA